MQFDNLASCKFFIEKDGGEDKVATAINCFEVCIYEILKNKYSDEGDMVASLFLREINPTLWIDNTTGIFRIHNPNDNITPPWRKFVKIEQFEKQHDESAIQLLESLLDKKQMVMIQTVFAKIKYYTWYNPEFDFSTFVDGYHNHVSLVVGHEFDNIFFVEKKPYNLDMQYFVPYEFNKEISIGHKKEFQEAFSYLLRCYIPSLNEEMVREPAVYEKEIKEILLQITQEYFAPAENVNGVTKYYGVSALQKLIEMCQNGEDIQNYYIIPNWDLINNIQFDIWLIAGARNILLKFVKARANKIEKSNEFDHLYELLIKSEKYWITLSSILVKEIKSGEKKLNERVASYLRKLSSLDDKLNEELTNMIQKSFL